MLRRLGRDQSGSALVEFAICVPFLGMLYLGSFVVSDMISCNRRVTLATRALTDMATRAYSPTSIAGAPTTFSATSILSSSAVVLTPYNVGNATEQISLLRICDQTNAYVVWTQAQTQTVAQMAAGTATSATSTLTAGTLPSTTAVQSSASVVPIPSTMVPAGSPLIPTSPDGSDVCSNLSPGVANKTQVGTAGGYLFVGQITYTYTPAISFTSATTIPMSDIIYMSPRLN